MLDIKLIRDSPELVRKNLEKRVNPAIIKLFTDLLKIDEEWRKLKGNIDDLRSRRNQITKEIQKLKTQNKDFNKFINEAKQIPNKIKQLEVKLREFSEKRSLYLYKIPNLLDNDVPVGKDENYNREIKKHGEQKKLNFKIQPHGELLQSMGLADFKRSAKVAGAGFYYLYGELALLEFALIKFAIDKITSKGYTYIHPPFTLNKEAYQGVTELSQFEEVLYKLEGENLYLIATAEHPLCAMYKDEIINSKSLPIKLVSFTPCFRKEIGKHGIDTRGLFRVHQFNKVEQFIFCKPQMSKILHEELLQNAEEIFQELGLSYRVVTVCTGDIGTVASKKYDIEAWMPREAAYKEVVSCSNCTSYQAVRSNIKFQDGTEKDYVHTLNSTAIATSRALRAIVENYYNNKDNTITVPKVLVPYMNGITKIPSK